VYVVLSCKIVFLGVFPIQLFRHICCKIYRSATVHYIRESQTDGQTDNIMMTIADHTVWQYDRLKMI